MKDSEDKVTYILYYRGRTRVVSREEWEQSWLDYWNRVSDIAYLD